MADGSLPIVVTPEAFGRGAFDLAVVEGLTVRGMLVEAIKLGLPTGSLDRTEIYVDGVRLPRDMALDHVLKRGQVVNVVVEPLGGGGGRKDIGQILLTVAIIVVSAWIGGPTGPLKAWPLIARVAAATAVQVLGSMAMNALYAPDTNAQAKANDRYALQSASNQYRQWGSMPLALGEVVAAPDLAAKTFTQSSGEDVWLYGILGVHYGACEVSELKIGDTLASTMGPGDFRMVQHLTPGPRTFQLYPNDVDQLDLQEELQATPSSATPLIRAASSDGDRFDIDFFMPGGLHFQKDDGRLLSASVSVTVRYRPVDASGAATGPWQSGPTMSRASKSKDPMRITHSVTLAHGRYEFELTRNRPDDDNDKRRDDIYVTAIKSVAFRKPVTDETLSIIEFAVRATAINQGGLAPITCRIKPLCQTWTGGGWSAPVATSNPAALARWLLTGPAPAKPLPTTQADVRLRAWSALCEQYNWSSHVYLTETKSQAEALQILERAGRASLFWDGSQVATAPWVEKPAPRQLFTGANLRDHRWEIVYPEPVHALRVEFQNFDKAGEPDELFVYADGYGETADPANGIQAATLIEALRLDGQATPNRAYRDGRWALGQRLHQRRVDTWTADIENLISQYGDRVRLAWRRVDGAEARVRCRRWTGGLVSGLRLTLPVEMVEGVDYAVDLRTVNGLFAAVPVQTRPGLSREIVFATPRGPNVCPSADDLVAFGVATRVSEDVEIVGIEPGENLSAVLTGIRYVAPLLMAGETGPIPPLQSRLTGERSANPPRPTLLGVQQDANGVRLSFDLPTWRGSPISGFTVRWRSKAESGETSTWSALPALDGAARELRSPPLREAPVDVAGVEATRVEIEITATTVDGRASLPLTATVVLPTPPQPLSSVWDVAAKASAADGTSQPILIVTGEVNDPNVAAVLIQWGLTAAGPWNDAYQGAPLTKALEIPGLTAGVEHYVAITHLSPQGVPSQFLVIGPRVPGALVSDNTINIGDRPTMDVLASLDDLLVDVPALAGQIGAISAEAAAATSLAVSALASGALNANARFGQAWESGAYPPGFMNWTNGNLNDREGPMVGPNSLAFNGVALNEARGLRQRPDLSPQLATLTPGWWVLEATAELKSGSLKGAGLYLYGYLTGGLTPSGWTEKLDFALDPDTTGAVQGDGVAGRTYRWSKLVRIPDGNATGSGDLYTMANWNGLGGGVNAAKSIRFGETVVRPATAAEIETGLARGAYTTVAARITNEETVRAGETGALATSQTQMQAVLRGQGALPKNPSFWGAWTGTYPDGWEAWGAPPPVKTTGQVSDKAARFIMVDNQDTGMAVVNGAGGWAAELSPGKAVMELIITLGAGSLSGAGLYMEAWDTAPSGILASWSINPLADKDTSGRVVGAGEAGRTYAFAKLVDVPASTDFARLFALANWGGFGPRLAKTVNYHHASVRKATAAEIAAGVAVIDPTALSARNAAQEGVLATTTGKLLAWSERTVAAGGAEAFLQMKAQDDNGNLISEINMGAQKIGLWTAVGSLFVPVLRLIGTSAHFAGKVFIGLLEQITIDPDLPAIIWKIGASRLVIGALPNDNMIYWFGPAMDPVDMRKSNATEWKDSTGGAFFSGQIIAGKLSNSGQGTDIGVGVSREVGPFGTNGNPIAVVFSYSFTRTSRRTAGAPLPANPAAVIRLYRKIGVGAESLVATMNVSGTAGADQNGTSDWTVAEAMSGSQTYTDTAGGTSDRTYRVEVFSRTLGSLPGSQVTASSLAQRYGITTSEN